jgi:hypothetical protein
VVLQSPGGTTPFIVKLVEPEQPSQWQRLSGVLLGSLGVTGVIVVGALVLGAVLAIAMYWMRSRAR